MPRIFRHYVPYDGLVLLGIESGIVLGSVLGSVAVVRLTLEAAMAPVASALPQAIVAALFVIGLFHLVDLYDLRRTYGRRELALRIGVAFITAYVMIAATGYLVPALRLHRKGFALSFLVAPAAVFLARLLYARSMRSSRTRRRVLLLGAGRPAQIIADTVNGSHPNYEMVGCIDGEPGRAGASVNGVRVLGATNELRHISVRSRADIIVVALTERRQALPVPDILDCKFRGIEVEDWPSFYEKLTGKILLTDLRPSWLIFSDGFAKNHLTLMVKRALDVLLASVGLILTLPLFPILAALIRLESPGPVLYRQERLGQGGRLFWLLKFRSMRQDAERQTGPVWATVGDARVTRIGRLLRKTRLDEIPQLINILRGEMSLVGPRPERPVFVEQLQEKIPFYIHRLAVKPGLTGWAQVKYHYAASVDDTREKLEYDLYYIKNLSVFLDLLIILQTIQIVLFARGAR